VPVLEMVLVVLSWELTSSAVALLLLLLLLPGRSVKFN
jgi:hypothetical protein